MESKSSVSFVILGFTILMFVVVGFIGYWSFNVNKNVNKIVEEGVKTLSDSKEYTFYELMTRANEFNEKAEKLSESVANKATITTKVKSVIDDLKKLTDKDKKDKTKLKGFSDKLGEVEALFPKDKEPKSKEDDTKKLNKDLEELKSKNGAKDKEIEELKKNQTDEKKLEAANKELDELKKQLVEKNKELEAAKKSQTQGGVNAEDYAKIQKELGDKEKKISELEESLRSISVDKSNLDRDAIKTKIEEINVNIKNLKESLGKSFGEGGMITKSIEDLYGKSSNNDALIKKLIELITEDFFKQDASGELTGAISDKFGNFFEKGSDGKFVLGDENKDCFKKACEKYLDELTKSILGGDSLKDVAFEEGGSGEVTKEIGKCKTAVSELSKSLDKIAADVNEIDEILKKQTTGGPQK